MEEAESKGLHGCNVAVIGWVNEGVGQAEAMQNVQPGLAHPMRKFWSLLESLAGSWAACVTDGQPASDKRAACGARCSIKRTKQLLSEAWLDGHGNQTKGSCT